MGQEPNGSHGTPHNTQAPSDVNNPDQNPPFNTQSARPRSRRPSRRRRPTRQRTHSSRAPPQGLPAQAQAQQPQGWADDDYYHDNPWFGQANKKPIFSLGAPLPHKPRRRPVSRKNNRSDSDSNPDEEVGRGRRRNGPAKAKPRPDEELGHISEASQEEDDDQPRYPAENDATERGHDYFSHGNPAGGSDPIGDDSLARKATGNSGISTTNTTIQEQQQQQQQQQRMTAAGVTHGQKYNAAGQPVFDYMPNQTTSPRSGGDGGRRHSLLRKITTSGDEGNSDDNLQGKNDDNEKPVSDDNEQKERQRVDDDDGEEEEDEVVLEKKRSQQQQPNYAIDSEPLGQKEDDLVEEGVVQNPDDMRNWWARARARHPEPLAEFLATTIATLLGLCGTLSVNLSASQPTKYGTYETCCWAWGFSWMFGIYLGGGVSGAHMNPAISMSLSLFRGFPLRACSVYVLSQMLGGLAAAGIAYALYADSIHHVDVNPAFAITAKTFFSTPRNWVGSGSAFANQVVGGAIMMMAVLALGDDQNNPPGAGMHALVLGLLVTTLKLTLGYNVGSALNPASDLGPRVVAWAAGVSTADAWGGNWWLYGPWVGTLVGSILGCIVYDFFVFVGSESPVNYRYAFDGWRTRGQKLKRFVPRLKD